VLIWHIDMTRPTLVRDESKVLESKTLIQEHNKNGVLYCYVYLCKQLIGIKLKFEIRIILV
jgi:hypothetical protein